MTIDQKHILESFADAIQQLMRRTEMVSETPETNECAICVAYQGQIRDLMKQLGESRNKTLEEASRLAESQLLDDPQSWADPSYHRAITDAVRAIRAAKRA